jgi:hypothetical protein
MINHESLVDISSRSPAKPVTAEVMLNLWASREFDDQDLSDPRVVATRAAIRDAKLPDRLFQPGGFVKVTQMYSGVEYSPK